MKTTTLFATLLLTLSLVGGCKDDDSSGGPTSPAPPTGVVRALCESVGLNVEAGALVGGDDCNQAFDFDDDESCQFAPVSQSFSGACQGLEQGCGADFSTSASGSVDFSPEFDSATGGLTAIRASGSVSAEFKGNLGGACGQIGNRSSSLVNISIEVEIHDDPVTAVLTGTLDLASAGATAPNFTLISSDGFEVRNPDAGQSFSESFELQPGTYSFSLRLQASPQFNGGASAGSFDLSLRFQ